MTYQEAKATLRELKYICGLGENLREAIDVLTEDKDLDEDRWLVNELVFDKHSPIGEYRRALLVNRTCRSKIPSEILAATIGARIKDARWAAVDKNNMMFWYKNEPVEQCGKYHCDAGELCCDSYGGSYQIYCKVADWTKAKWQLRELEE